MPEHFYFRLVHRDIGKRMNQCRAMHIMAGIMMIVYSLPFLASFNENWIQILAILPPSLLIIFMAVFNKKVITDPNNNRVFRILEAGILLMGCMAYLKTNQLFAAALYGGVACILLYILYVESRLFSKQYIDVTTKGVRIALPTHNTETEWQEISHIIVKDDYFTLQTTKEQIRQYPIFNSLTAVEYEAFVQFCRVQTARHSI